MGVKTALINGRISVRSIDAYLRLRPFFRHVLGHVDAFSMILQEDADRIRWMGADPRKIEVNGNAKYDLLPKMIDPAAAKEVGEILKLSPAQKVFVAGSTRRGEEAMILDAYEQIVKAFPDTLLVVAPRHIDRTPGIAVEVRERGLGCRLWSELKKGDERPTPPVVIVDTFGELFRLYSVATLVFCGGSFAPLGGQNPLEAAVWGKVVFYGPHMENFLDAKELLDRAGTGVSVGGSAELAEKASWFLKHPEALAAEGARAREAVLGNQKVAEKHARVIAGLFENSHMEGNADDA
jgi:3-deoxy-D-manno-octulosonic-acid transferase